MAVSPMTRRGALFGACALLPSAWLAASKGTALTDMLEARCAGSGKELEVWEMVRELLERCKDFERLEAIYDSSDVAWTFYDDAYHGIVENAKCIHWSEELGIDEAEIRSWVSEIYPDDVEWVVRIDPQIQGLSEAFAELGHEFENNTRELAEWSALPMHPLQMRLDKFKALRKHSEKFCEMCRVLHTVRAVTPGDRALKRRAIEHNYCGLGGRIAKAKHAYGYPDPPSRADLAVAVEIYKSRGFHLLRWRLDWRDWEWIYA